MISFVVFESAPEEGTQVFKPGAAFMQMLFVPAEQEFEPLE